MIFRPESFLIKAIEGKNIRDIRVALSTYITKDAGNHDGQILEAVNYVQNEYGDIWQEHDNREEESRENWSTAYLGLLQSDLMNNFSKERFNHILEVGSYLYPKKQKTAFTSDNNNSDASRDSQGKNSTKGQQPMKTTYNRNVKMTKGSSDMGKYLVLSGVLVLGLLIYLIARD